MNSTITKVELSEKARKNFAKQLEGATKGVIVTTIKYVFGIILAPAVLILLAFLEQILNAWGL